MENEKEISLGVQPIAKLIEVNCLRPKDIVSASSEQLTFKMLSKAVKGRRLSSNVKMKILNAFNAASQKKYLIKDLFNY